MTSTQKTIYLIPDTNVFMQCRNIEELPWKTTFPEFDAIIVVLITPVMREIDRLKGAQGRLAKRARIASSLIGRLIDAPVVELGRIDEKQTVTLIAVPELNPDQALQADLDYTHADNAIVGTVSAFVKIQENQHVALLSNDNVLLMNARRTNVPFRRVPSDWLLPAESDEDQKHLKALQKEIKQLRDAEPVCVIRPHGQPWEFEKEYFQPLTVKQIQSLLGMLKDRFPSATDFNSEKEREPRPETGLIRLYQEEFVQASDDEIVRYNQEKYPEWLSQCEGCFRELHRKLQSSLRPPKIKIDLLNNGSRPAEDVRVAFDLRGNGLLLRLPRKGDASESIGANIDIDEENKTDTSDVRLARPPSAPSRHRKRTGISDLMETTLAQVARASSLMKPYTPIKSPVLPSPRESDAFYWKTGVRPTQPKSGTELNCKQWRHQTEPESFEFEILSPIDRDSCEGALHVEIHASNLSNPVKKTIPIKLFSRRGNTWEEANKLIDHLEVYAILAE